MPRNDSKTSQECNLRRGATDDLTALAAALRGYAGATGRDARTTLQQGAGVGAAVRHKGQSSALPAALHAARTLPTYRTLNGSASEANGLPVSKGWSLPADAEGEGASAASTGGKDKS